MHKLARKDVFMTLDMLPTALAFLESQPGKPNKDVRDMLLRNRSEVVVTSDCRFFLKHTPAGRMAVLYWNARECSPLLAKVMS